MVTYRMESRNHHHQDHQIRGEQIQNMPLVLESSPDLTSCLACGSPCGCSSRSSSRLWSRRRECGQIPFCLPNCRTSQSYTQVSWGRKVLLLKHPLLQSQSHPGQMLSRWARDNTRTKATSQSSSWSRKLHSKVCDPSSQACHQRLGEMPCAWPPGSITRL